MSRNGKVIVAMSGGVDSSVAACLLKGQGYDPVGVFMCVGHAATRERAAAEDDDDRRTFKHGCCSPTDQADARRIAGRLGIGFHVLNFEQEFAQIVDYFVDEYARGRTPNPCVQCNTHIKFGKLLEYADMVDAQYVSTGHYARVLLREDPPGTFLAQSRNAAKDQTYALFGIRRDILPRCLFPMGEFTDKTEVRRIAADLGLQVHDKPDSQEICFVPDNDYASLVRDRRPETAIPGEIRDRAGNVLGHHDGIIHYTIGQRRGLGVAAGIPIYVTRLNVLDHSVTVGPRDELLAGGLIADNMNWLMDPPVDDHVLNTQIKIRYQHNPVSGTIRSRDNDVHARFDAPQPAVTPGQAAVFYTADGCVVGGGWIRRALSCEGDD